ncbi:carboxypeptidase A1-like isoform X1 [Rhincodon typus]|uniref:carboxypeptidase A1-like isoform X1 n=1 Tax=Rhincodon typus TaxID=259920 RepID=UPI0009A3BE8B|nr:carboxypeptidase A1-like isoform X1 [Rhincodon typus]
MRTHFIFLTLLVAIYAQSEFEGDQVLRITPRDEKQVSLVMSLEDQEHLKLDIWRRPVKSDLIIDVHVPENSLQSFKVFLEYNDIQYSVMIEDLQVMIDNEKAELEQMTMMERSTSSFNYGKYHTLNEIYSWMDSLANEFPGLVQKQQIGTSFEGRPLYVLKFSTGGTGRPAIWIDSGIHAREWVSPASAIWMAKKISSDYGQEPFITSLLRKMDIYMEIVVNPDGYVYTHTKNRLWRKTRSTRPGRKCVGVDANRNFDAGFGGPGTSSNPCMETYRGPYPNSEHEVAAIVNFVQSHRNIKSFITIHSYSQLLMFPFGYKCVPPANYQELDALAKSAVSSLATLYGTRYKIGSICEAIYQASGGSIDWTYNEGIKYSFAFELRDTGRYGFLLPSNQIVPTAEETWLAMKTIMSYVSDRS